MSYENPDVMIEVSTILESFEIEDLREIIDQQINDPDIYVDLPVDHLKPLHVSYAQLTELIEDGAVDEDKVQLIRDRYRAICLYVIERLLEKYNMEIDEEWLESSLKNIIAVANVMYYFFIIDFYQVVLTTLSGYIFKNSDSLAEAFGDTASSKDVATSTNMKNFTKEYAIIVSNIYDVTDYSFSLIDAETIFDYLDAGYIVAGILNKLYDTNKIEGDFVNVIRGIYSENISLRSKITFELISSIKSTSKETNTIQEQEQE